MFKLEQEAPRRLLAEGLRRTIPSVSPSIPSYNSLQRNVQMIRQRINLPLTIPNENFLLYDDPENDEEKFILFATPCQLHVLSLSSSIYFD
ncbi:hypothetical protein HZS_4355 [Henneguya salminicola]|nr:hypothetical protein HZS_4355 [Henneguya salminicola]